MCSANDGRQAGMNALCFQCLNRKEGRLAHIHDNTVQYSNAQNWKCFVCLNIKSGINMCFSVLNEWGRNYVIVGSSVYLRYRWMCLFNHTANRIRAPSPEFQVQLLFFIQCPAILSVEYFFLSKEPTNNVWISKVSSKRAKLNQSVHHKSEVLHSAPFWKV